MRNYYLTLLLICICGLCFAQQQTNDISTKNPPNKEWNFNNLDGWKYGHQDNNPDNQCILENGYLRIFTRANSVDRKKGSYCRTDLYNRKIYLAYSYPANGNRRSM